MQEIEEKLAHLLRSVDDLSEIVARQDKELTRLNTQVKLLLQREAEREAAEGGGIVIGNERPPHW